LNKQVFGAVLITWLMFPIQAVVAAEGIRKIVRADGVIEYTNVSSGASGSAVPVSKRRSNQSNTYESIYKYRESNGVLTFSDKKPKKGTQFATLKFACFACNPSSSVNWHRTPLNLTSYTHDVIQSAKKHAVDPALVRAVMHAESSFNKLAVSSQGAQGLMQLMPATAKELGVNNALDAAQNIQGGVKYLGELLAMYQGDISRATAAYNAGPGAVKKYNGIPPYAETQAYVKRVGILYKRYQHAIP
jgi:soluble lytic murein transglycosylase-like protein